jgi:hypothetical protein
MSVPGGIIHEAGRGRQWRGGAQPVTVSQVESRNRPINPSEVNAEVPGTG